MHYIVLKEIKVILFWSSKSGSSSIKTMLLEYFNLSLESVHRNEVLNEKIDNLKDLHNHKLYTDYTKYLICRSPYDRLVSAFLNKYVGNIYKNPEKCHNFQDFVRILYKDFLKYMEDRKKLSNLNTKNQEQVRFHLKHNNVYNNNHFKPQTSGNGWTMYNKLGRPKFDYIYDTAEVSSIRNVLKLDKQTTYHCRPHDKNNRSENNIVWNNQRVELLDYSVLSNYTIPYDLFYNTELREKVYSIYESDFIFLKSIGKKY
jgi:hypothetical protein